MSMPMDLQVVVVSKDSLTAGIAASVLRGDDEPSIRPWISAAHIEPPSNKSSLRIAAAQRTFNIEAAASYYFIDARRVDLWLALDAKSAESTRIYIVHNGPAPTGFYRGIFPEPVVSCDFETPWVPSSAEGLDEWISTLTGNLEPWKQRIWDAFRDSS